MRSAVSAWGLLICMVLPVSAGAYTADELIAKNIEARGGSAKLAAVQSLRLAGRLNAGGGLELEFAQMTKRPGMTRNEVSLQGMTAVQAYDGKEGWQIQPFQGRKDPEKMAADDYKSLVDDSDLDGPLVNYKAKGNKVEYLGTEDVDGSEAHKLRVVQSNGDKRLIYLDPDYFLAIRVLYQRQVRGREVEQEVDLGDYEKVNGVYLPFAIGVGPKGSTEKAQILIDKAEANLPLEDALFHFPKKP